MNNDDIVKMLDEINNYLEKEEYQKALCYIKKKKSEINVNLDPSSKYIDSLIKELK